MFSWLGWFNNRFSRAAHTCVDGLLRSVGHGGGRSGGVGSVGLHLLFVCLALPVAASLMVLGVLLDVLSGQRPLNAEEQALALRMFGPGLKLHRVRITTHSWVLDVLHRLNGARPFVTMYSIHACRGSRLDAPTLVHELTHVWQAQKEGPLYLVHALVAQWGAAWRAWLATRRFDDHAAYHFTDAQLAQHAGVLRCFNHEQQACIMAAYCAHVLHLGQPITAERAAWLERYAQCVR